MILTTQFLVLLFSTFNFSSTLSFPLLLKPFSLFNYALKKMWCEKYQKNESKRGKKNFLNEISLSLSLQIPNERKLLIKWLWNCWHYRNQSERIESGGKMGGDWQFVLNGQRMKRWQVKVSNLKGLLVKLIPVNGKGASLHHPTVSDVLTSR